MHEAILRFLEYCELDKNLSPKSVKMYGYYLGFFEEWLTKKLSPSLPAGQDSHTEQPVRPPINVESINEDIIREFRLFLSHEYKNPFKGDLKKQTQNYFLVALRSFFRYLIKQKQNVLSPEMIELGKQRDRAIKFLMPEELEKLFSVVQLTDEMGYRDRTILEVLFSTGPS